tara:strand:+ start:9048 stop:13598 length:4551 start_codon:yes stop_codon:yes gene_type:complete
MLGIGNIVTAGSKVANVVRKGLQAWYKADQTQAPLSEEKIHNPNFSLGPNVDLLNHNNWYRNTTTPSATNIADGPDFIAHGNTPDTPISSGTTGVTLTEHGFRYKTTGSSTFISMAQSNIMNSAAANEETLMLTYDILQNSGSGILYIAMSSNDQALDVTVGKNKVHYFTPTASTFQIKRGGSNVDITIANIRLVKTNPTIRGNKWAVSKLASQDMTCTLTQSSDLVTHPSNTNIKVGMKVQGSGIPTNTTITEVNVNGSNTQFRISNNASSNAPATSALRIRAASTIQVEDGVVSIDYKNTDATNTGISIGGKIKVNQKYQVEVVVDELNTDKKIKIHTGNDFNTLSLGVNTFEMMSTTNNTISLARTEDGTSVTAKVSKVSLKEITNSVKDFSTNSNDAILYSGKALNFAGTADNIDLGILNSTAINTSTKLTVALWFNADVLADDMIFSAGQDGDNRFYLWTNSSELQLGFGDRSGVAAPDVGTQPTLETNKWYRVVIVVDGLTANVYLDGEFKYNKQAEAFTTEDSLHLGIHANEGTPYSFDGQLSDVQVYDKAWTILDVEYDYNNPDKDVFDNTDAEALGPELVNNGDFSTDSLSGYSNVYATKEIVDGKLKVTQNNSSVKYGLVSWGWDSAPTKMYRVSVDCEQGTAKHTIIKPHQGIVSFGSLTAGDYTFSDIITTTTSSPAIRMQQSTDDNSTTAYAFFDNLSIKEVLKRKTDILPTDCLALYRLNEGVGNRLYNAAPALGEELVLNNDFSGGVQGNGLPNNWEHHADNTSTAEVGTFKGKDNVVKIVMQGDGLSQSKLAQDFTFKNSTVYQVEAEVFIESGNFKFDTEGGNFLNDFILTSNTDSERGYWRTIKSNFQTKSDAEGSGDHLFLRSSSNVASVIYLNKVSVKEIIPLKSQVQESWVSGNWITAQPYIPQYAMSSYSKKAFFDGVDDWASNANSLSHVSRLKDYSVSLWVVPYSLPPVTDPATRDGLFQNSQSATDRNGISLFPDGTIRAGHYGDTEDGAGETLNWTSAASDSSVELGKLYHVVFTNEAYTPGGSNGTKLYINGILQSGTSSTYTAAATGIYIGKNTNGTERSNSLIDEVSVFSKALNKSEVQEIFNAGTALDARDHSKYLGSELIIDNTWAFETVDADNTINGVTSPGTNTSSDGSFRFITESTGSPAIDIKKSNLVEVDHYYELSYDITSSNHNTGLATYTVYTGNTGAVQQTLNTSVGSHKLNFYSKNTFFIIKRNASGIDVTISNISLKKINLHGYWRNNGAEPWYDLSLNSNDCAVSGTPDVIQLQEVPLFKRDSLSLPMNKVRQRGFNLDGLGYAKVDDNSTLGTIGGGFTCSFWYRHAENIGTNSTGPNSWYYLVNKGRGLQEDADIGFGTAIYDNRIYFDLNTSVQRYSLQHTIGAASSESPVWYYITATYNGSNQCILYVDAEARYTISNVSGSVSATAEAHPITVGTNYSYNQQRARTVLDEVKWYNRPLSLSEIKRNFNSSKSKHSSTSNWSDDFSSDFI